MGRCARHPTSREASRPHTRTTNVITESAHSSRSISDGPFAELGATRIQPVADLTADGVISYAHLGGACAMGQDGEPNAVLDARCRVRGVKGLRVVDAAALPVLPAGNTYLGCVMMAERAAQLI